MQSNRLASERNAGGVTGSVQSGGIMAMRVHLIAIGFVGVASIMGCGAEADLEGEMLGEEEDVLGEAESALVQLNALSENAISLNAISLNAISLNALNLSTLDPNDIAAIQDPGTNGTLARQFVRYAVGCALTTSQSFSFSWTDGQGALHNEVYPGQLGVAPSWATGPLNLAGQRIVSACVAARVNYYEVSVVISLRSIIEPLKTLTGSAELANYPDIEGAFWGNLFDSQPFINACYNTDKVNNSRAWQRDCAVGHLTGQGTQTVECGIIHVVGSCAGVCQSLNCAGKYYPSCIEKPGSGSTTTKAVVTTALP
jgi:hypothetical protein